MAKLNEYMDSFFQYKDSKYFTAKAVKIFIKRKYRNIIESSKIQERLLEVMLKCNYSEKMDDEKPKYLFKIKVSSKIIKKTISQNWISLLRLELSYEVKVKILGIISEEIIPYISQPRLLTDLLINTYSCNNDIGLLSLFGIFTLITCYNIECPNFYHQLYLHLKNIHLLSNSTWRECNKLKFWNILQTVLSSDHLPVYMIKSFIKRIMRNALFLQLPDLIISLNITAKLLAVHPSSRSLLVSSNTNNKLINQDPYIYEEDDFMKSNANNSFLWELKTLLYHTSPIIPRMVKSMFEDSKNAWNWRLTYSKPPKSYQNIDYINFVTQQLLQLESNDMSDENTKPPTNYSSSSISLFTPLVMFNDLILR